MKPSISDFEHYAERYQRNKDAPEFIEWWTDNLDKNELKAIVFHVMSNIDYEVLAKCKINPF